MKLILQGSFNTTKLLRLLRHPKKKRKNKGCLEVSILICLKNTKLSREVEVGEIILRKQNPKWLYNQYISSKDLQVIFNKGQLLL